MSALPDQPSAVPPAPVPPREAGLKSKALKGSVWFGIAQLFDRLVSTATLLVLVRLLGDAAFGVLAQAMVYVGLGGVLVTAGLTEALIQRSEIDQTDRDTVFWTTVGFASIITLVLIWVAPWLATTAVEPMLSPVLTAIAMLMPVRALGVVHEAELSRSMRFSSLAVRQTIANVVGAVVAVVAAVSGAGLWTLVLQQLSVRVVATAGVWLACDYRPSLGFSVARLSPLLGFGVASGATRLSSFAVQRSHEAVMGWKLPSQAVGQYYVAGRLVDVLVSTMTLMLNRVVLPTFSKVQNDLARVRRGYQLAVQTTAAITLPIFVGLAATAPEAIVLAVGEDRRAAAPVLMWLALGALVSSLSAYNSNVLLAVGRPMYPFWIQITHAVTHLGTVAVVLWMLAERRPWSEVLVWTAAAISIRRALYWPVPLLVLRKVIGLDIGAFFWSLRGPAVASLAMCAVVVVWRSQLADGSAAAVSLAGSVALGGAVYGSVLVLVDRRMVGRLVVDGLGVLPDRVRSRGPLSRVRSVGVSWRDSGRNSAP